MLTSSGDQSLVFAIGLEPQWQMALAISERPVKRSGTNPD